MQTMKVYDGILHVLYHIDRNDGIVRSPVFLTLKSL